MKTSLSISIPVLFGTGLDLGVTRRSFSIKQKVMNNWWSIGNAICMASIFGFGAFVIITEIIGSTFIVSLRLKLEDWNLDLRMKWIPVGEGKIPVLANEKCYCQTSAGKEPEWRCQTKEDAEPQLIFSGIFLICFRKVKD